MSSLTLAAAVLTLLGVLLVLLAVRRAERTAAARAARETDQIRRTVAAIVELRGEIAQLRNELLRVAARLETQRADTRSRTET